jgi:hypothetical protein
MKPKRKTPAKRKRPAKKKDYYLSPEEEAIGKALIEAGEPKGQESVVKYRAMLRWDGDTPFLTCAPERLSKDPQASIPDLLRKVLDMPYQGDNPAYEGLSFGEALVISMARDAADGSGDARDAILDRLLGKPKQSIESVQITATLNDFLDSVAQSELHTTVDVMPEPPSPPPASNDSAEDL